MTQTMPSHPNDQNHPQAAPPAASLPAAEAAERRDWPAYFDRMAGKPARETLLTAIENSDEPGLAIDLGCGDGPDTQAMLEQGWRVWAIDGSDDGIRRARSRESCAQAESDGRLTLTVGDFEQIASGEITLPSTTLLNASFALPFCPPHAWKKLWAAIDNAIEPGGRFSGQLFGDRDGWAIIEDRTHLTRDQALELFEGYVIESLREEDRPSTQPDMPHKHWHVFHVIARKRHTQVATGDPS